VSVYVTRLTGAALASALCFALVRPLGFGYWVVSRHKLRVERRLVETGRPGRATVSKAGAPVRPEPARGPQLASRRSTLSAVTAWLGPSLLRLREPPCSFRGKATCHAGPSRSHRLPGRSRNTATRPYGSVRGEVTNSTPADLIRS
jgi:hypothetical protein